MGKVSNIIKSLMQKEPGMNPTRLARETGVSQPTIWKVLNDRIADPGTDVLEPIAKRFHVAVAQLRGELPIDTDLPAELEPGRYLFPRRYANVVASQGNGRFNDDFHIEVEGTIPIPASLVAARGWNVARLAVVATDGRSMYPTLGEDEPVVVNLDETKIVNGKVYAIEDVDDGLRVKRLVRQADGRILVRSDNPDKFTYPDDYLTPDSSTRVVGRVVFRSGEL